MRRIFLTLAAVGLTVPVAISFPQGNAIAKTHYYRGTTARRHRECTYNRGTTGLVAGGVGGALVGDKLIGHGVAGPILGAVGGAFAGQAIDRSMTAHRRCRWVYN